MAPEQYDAEVAKMMAAVEAKVPMPTRGPDNIETLDGRAAADDRAQDLLDQAEGFVLLGWKWAEADEGTADEDRGLEFRSVIATANPGQVAHMLVNLLQQHPQVSKAFRALIIEQITNDLARGEDEEEGGGDE